MICGFQTAHGSLYAINPETGRTTRFKLSGGRGHREVDDPSMCLYVPPKAMPYIEEHYLGLGHLSNALRLGMRKKDGPRAFIPFTEKVSVPEGFEAIVAIINNSTRKPVCTGSAVTEPQEGYIPIEKNYLPGNISETHVGNPITKIFADPDELLNAAIDANAPEKFINAISGEPPRTNNGLLPKPNGKAPKFRK